MAWFSVVDSLWCHICHARRVKMFAQAVLGDRLMRWERFFDPDVTYEIRTGLSSSVAVLAKVETFLREHDIRYDGSELLGVTLSTSCAFLNKPRIDFELDSKRPDVIAIHLTVPKGAEYITFGSARVGALASWDEFARALGEVFAA